MLGVIFRTPMSKWMKEFVPNRPVPFPVVVMVHAIFFISSDFVLFFDFLFKDNAHCMYCPPGEEECTIVTGITDRDACENAIACELPSGEIVFDLTETECR